ncbi:MAG: hypothetical protein H0T21_09975, partial [Gemmatimonadaceae bacterium]|nr:hypothetical protein [Gemmatimonadaceae bacterium]
MMSDGEVSMNGGKELLARVQAGSAGAFTVFVERYKPVVFRWAVGLVSDGDEAEDIVQEVFVICSQKLGSFRGDGS